ncbi:15-hydroxyprostaglandin dehydrogenase [Astrocystis sublimbata]|nr:15-hydroxyprostaglandin dehydrogenase [Astrocystis sublimbata]
MAVAPRSVIVTGGASGLGKSMNGYFAAKGDIVTILDVNEVDGPAVATELGKLAPPSGSSGEEAATVRFRKCDVSSWEEQKAVFKAVYEDVGRIDVVIANAGITEGGRSSVVPPSLAALEREREAGVVSEEEGKDAEPQEPLLKVLNVNLVGNVYSVQLAFHYMRLNTPDAMTGLRGSIVCTASNAGLYPFPLQPLYAASKHGVIGLVRSLAHIYAQPRFGVQINALAPAVLETNIAGDVPLPVFANMVITPHSTLLAGVEKFLADSSLTGQVAEIHGESVTLRPPHEYVDADSEANINEFTRIGSLM